MYNNNYGNVAGAYNQNRSYGNYGQGNNMPSNVAGANANNLTPFFRQLSPGTRVTIQYDCQPPATGIFQGFQDGLVLLDNFNGFPGLTRLSPNKINAVSPFSGGGHGGHGGHEGHDCY